MVQHSEASHLQLHRCENLKPRDYQLVPSPEKVGDAGSVNGVDIRDYLHEKRRV
jgi:hypothetical protein